MFIPSPLQILHQYNLVIKFSVSINKFPCPIFPYVLLSLTAVAFFSLSSSSSPHPNKIKTNLTLKFERFDLVALLTLTSCWPTWPTEAASHLVEQPTWKILTDAHRLPYSPLFRFCSLLSPFLIQILAVHPSSTSSQGFLFFEAV